MQVKNYSWESMIPPNEASKNTESTHIDEGVLRNIFSYLNPQEALQCRSVSKNWKAHIEKGKTIKDFKESLEKKRKADQYLQDLSQKSSLSLREDITDQGLSFLKDNKNLRSLNLKDCTNITDEGRKVLETLPHLESLNLNSCKITDQGLKTIGKLKNLKSLDLSFCGEYPLSLTDQGIKELKELKNLKSLKLCGSSITDKGVETLSELTELESLRLSNCKLITDQVFLKLASLKNLRRLNLGFSRQITGQGLRNLSNLESVTLHDCPYDDDLLKEIEAQEKLKSVKRDWCLSRILSDSVELRIRDLLFIRKLKAKLEPELKEIDNGDYSTVEWIRLNGRPPNVDEWWELKSKKKSEREKKAIQIFELMYLKALMRDLIYIEATEHVRKPFVGLEKFFPPPGIAPWEAKSSKKVSQDAKLKLHNQKTETVFGKKKVDKNEFQVPEVELHNPKIETVFGEKEVDNNKSQDPYDPFDPDSEGECIIS